MTTTTQWKSEAGPRQTKKVNKAISNLNWKGKTFVEITDHGRIQLTSPFGERSLESGDAALEIGERFGWLVTRDNHKDVIEAFETAARALILPEIDKRTTAEERAENARKNEEMEAKRKVKAEQKISETAEHEAKLRKEYPWAKPDNGKMSGQARAAANLRKELKLAFPGVTFSVRSESFSMGDSVDIGWTEGPTTKEVEVITGKYQYGYFDGMQDMYCDDRSAYGDAVEKVLGRSKFVQCNRCIEDVRETVGRLLCEVQRVEYDGHNTRHVFGNGDDQYLSDHVYQILQRTTFPVGGTISGIEHDEEECHYFLTFDTPELEEKSTTNSQATEVQKHYHTKRGVDFWLVVLSDRIERPEFETIRNKCKAAGGWYSRKWGSAPGGFAFDNQDDAETFSASV